MDNSSYNRRQGSRSPHGDPQQRGSPLRSGSGRGPMVSRKQQIDEEEEYERRRQEELRRQIRLKEQELEQLSNNKDRLRMRLDREAGRSQEREGPVRSQAPVHGVRTSSNDRTSSSPLRASGDRLSQRNYSQGRNQTTAYQQERVQCQEGSPMRHRSPSRPDFMTQPAPQHLPTDGRRLAPAEYVSQLHSDNASLQRRLNLVLQELDRVNRERSNLANKLGATSQDADSLQRMLESEDSADQVNRDMQAELMDHRDANRRTKDRISDIDRVRTDAIQKLRMLQNERERRVNNNEEINHDLASKQNLARDIQEEQFAIQDKIQKVSAQIDHIQRHEHQEEHVRHDLQIVIDRLMHERDGLQDKLENLNRTYDNCVYEISRERQQMNNHNDHHSKLLVSKVIFQLLEVMVATRKQHAMNEFFTYCRFDSKCHTTLKNFVGILDRLGKYQMRIGLKQWYQKAFKPIEMFEQEYDLSDAHYQRCLKQKLFFQWLNLSRAKNSDYTDKLRACKAVWAAKNNDVRKEKARFFSIWRDSLVKHKRRELKLKNLILSVHHRRLHQAWHHWTDSSRELMQTVRMHVLARELANDQYAQITYSQMKIRTSEAKRMRLNKLRHLFKAWQDSNAYRKYMMGQNVAAMQLKRTINENIVKACFDVLRHHKEIEKHMLMKEALEGDCLPAIEKVSLDIKQVGNQALRSSQERALHCIERMVKASMMSYFAYWKGANEDARVGIKDNMKDQLLRLYHTKLSSAFVLWKKGRSRKLIQTQQRTIKDLVHLGNDLNAQNIQLSKDIKFQKQEVERAARAALNRGAHICVRRFLRYGIRQWRAQVQKLQDREQGAGLIIKKLRQSLCRSAFEIYCKKVQLCRQEDKDELRLQFFRNTLAERTKRRIFNALCAYDHLFEKARTYWSIVLKKMDVWMKRRAFNRWNAQGNLKKEQLLRASQNHETEVFDDLNHTLGQKQNLHEEKLNENKQLNLELRHQGERLLANVFARYYYVGQTRGFEKWKDYVAFQKHQEAVIKKTHEHWERHQWNFAKAIFQNWVRKTRIHETRMQLAHTQQEVRDQNELNTHNKKLHDETVNHLNMCREDQDHQAEILSGKLEKTLGIIIRKNDVNYFQNNLRFIFTQWAEFVRRQKRFVTAVKNVIEKSLWQRGFDEINAFSIDKRDTRAQNRAVQKMRRLFWQKTCGSAFSLWRENRYSQVVMLTQHIEDTTRKAEETHLERKEKIKDYNCQRGMKVFEKKHMANYWQAWRNVIRWMKNARWAKETKGDTYSAYLVRRALKKWCARKSLTIKCRAASQKFNDRKELIYKKAVFASLQYKFTNEKNFCIVAANAAAKFDNRMMQSAFQMIFNFARAKQVVHNNSKAVAQQDIYSILNNVWKRRMTHYLSHLRSTNLREKAQDGTKANCLLHFVTMQVRDYFNKWKHQTEKARCVQDVNEVGPVVEAVLEHQIDVKNLKGFMVSQGYTNNEVETISEKCMGRSKELIARAVARMKAYSPDNDAYLLPKMFDRWRMFVKIRKLVKHWMQYMENRFTPVKADMARAFDLWKYRLGYKEKGLHSGLDIDYLRRRAVEADYKLSELDGNNEQNEALLAHLGLQRDELLEQYLKSQKMGIACARDAKLVSMHRGFSKWLDSSHQQKKLQLESILQRNIDVIASLKDKIREIECDNEALANENEELRQFSLDGYQIAKNVQSLTNEREKLSVDLADKANTIKKLLDENDFLNSRLSQAQEQAVHLMNQSHLNMNRGRHHECGPRCHSQCPHHPVY